MTFVKTKLLIERAASGESMEVRLKGLEPLNNVPRSIAELGHEIVSMTREPGEAEDGIHRLVLRKK